MDSKVTREMKATGEINKDGYQKYETIRVILTCSYCDGRMDITNVEDYKFCGWCGKPLFKNRI